MTNTEAAAVNQALFLLDQFDEYPKALDHAVWAFLHVTKVETKYFWVLVIETLTKQL